MTSKALGKGLSALIPDQIQGDAQDKISFVDLDLVKDNSLQPRTNYDEEKLTELKDSIKDQGVLQPILVREKQNGYEVVAGERRLKAARALNLPEIPVIIKDVTDQEALVIALIENIQREELNPIEEAEAYKKLIEDFQYTQENVAKSVGKDRSTVSNILRLLKLPTDVIKKVYDGGISFGHARALLGADSTAEQKRLSELIIKKGLSVREVESIIRKEQKSITKTEKKALVQNPQIATVEEGLQKLLGTKVSINAKKKRGKIVIDYYSLEDLDRIVKLIIK